MPMLSICGKRQHTINDDKLPKKEGFFRFLANYNYNFFSDYNPLFDRLRIPRIPIELSL